ncbi:MAG: BrnT family toxin [Proteobacteria bacterium]|nr:BrnT family toxin [Pseudomonadota bacterium]
MHYTKYEWDEKKAATNFEKHGISFMHVEKFDWSTAMIIPDNRRTYGEPRFLAYGMIEARLYVMVYTLRRSAVRIIGLRQANERERNQYEENEEN